MYKFILTFFLTIITQSAFAQIPNAGFENWTVGNPEGWFADNVAVTTVTQSSIPHSGSYSARGEAVLFYGQVMPPTIQTGDNARGFAYNQRPVSVTGYYQFFPVTSSGDRFTVDAVLYKGGIEEGTPVAVGALAISTAASSYTQFSATFLYSTSDIPDTCVINISIIGPGTGQQSAPHAGSYYLLDDLAFSGSTDVENQRLLVPAAMNLEQNYPNPFNPSTTISYSLSKASYVKLSVYNVLGKELTTLADGFQTAGNHSARFLASNMASGVYFYRLEAEGHTAMKQMLLIK